MPLPPPPPKSDFEQIVDELHAVLADASLDYGVFRLAQAEHASPRRVVWIPISFETRELKVSGPIRGADGARALYVESWLVEAHIVGDSFRDTELIRVRLVDVSKRVLETSQDPVGGLWVTQALGGAASAFGGLEKVVQRFRWQMYLFEPPPAAGGLAIIQRVDTTVALPPDDPDATTFTEPTVL